MTDFARTLTRSRASCDLKAYPGRLASRGGLCDQPSQHYADHGHADEGASDAAVPLEVSRKAAVAADPGQAALNDPSLGQHDETVSVAAADDLDCPPPDVCDGRCHAWSLISGIADDAFDERDAADEAAASQPSRSRR
jgi:hypothetical protein